MILAFTEDEIIKGLECCGNIIDEDSESCLNCPYNDLPLEDCVKLLHENAISIIKALSNKK